MAKISITMGGLGVFVQNEDRWEFVLVDPAMLSMPPHKSLLIFDPKNLGDEEPFRTHFAFQTPDGRRWAALSVHRTIVKLYNQDGSAELSSGVEFTDPKRVYSLHKAHPGFGKVAAACLSDNPLGAMKAVSARMSFADGTLGVADTTQYEWTVEPNHIGSEYKQKFARTVQLETKVETKCFRLHLYPFGQSAPRVLKFGAEHVEDSVDLVLCNFPPMPESNRHVRAFYHLCDQHPYLPGPDDRCWPDGPGSFTAPCSVAGARTDCIPGLMIK